MRKKEEVEDEKVNVENQETSSSDLARSSVLNMPSKAAFLFGASKAMYSVDMTLDAPKMNATFEGKFKTLNYKDEACSSNGCDRLGGQTNKL